VRRASLLILALLAPASAGTKDPPKPASFDEPAHGLDAFRTALAAQRAGKAPHPLRVSYFGDSLTADDHLTDALRKRLQALVGDGGPGFVFAVPPHPFCQLRAIARVPSDGWTAYGVSNVVPPDHLLGLGGSAEVDEGGTIRFAPLGSVRAIDVYYLAQPHGGALDLVFDGKVATTLRTDADHKQGAFARTDVPDGAKRFELRARGRVRLFGATMEAKTGAVVDNLGVINATAKAMRTTDLEDHLKNQLAHRAPDLYVVMYGTNEAEWLAPRGAGMAEHEKLFGELLATLRAAAPEASCLVVSPLDQLDWHDDKMPPRESIPAMVAAQHRAATEHGCAFWSVYDWMGGKGSSKGWNARGWMIKDFQHPTSEGAERIAEALYAGLVATP
jgi:lysophospholipase L1-like esterase